MEKKKLTREELHQKLQNIRDERNVELTEEEKDKAIRQLEINMCNLGSRLVDTIQIYRASLNLITEEFEQVRELYKGCTDETYLDREEAKVLEELNELN